MAFLWINSKTIPMLCRVCHDRSKSNFMRFIAWHLKELLVKCYNNVLQSVVAQDLSLSIDTMWHKIEKQRPILIGTLVELKSNPKWFDWF